MLSKTNIMLTYMLLVFIWATTPLAIVWSVSDLHPFWALVLRFFCACPIALMILVLSRTRLPLDAQSIHSYVAGAFSFIVSQIFTYLAVDYLSSGMIALMFGLAPLMTGILGVIIFKIQLHATQWLGMLVALFGLSIICFAGNTQLVQPVGIGLMMISVMIYCGSIFWIKKVNAPLKPLAQATGSIGVSTLIALAMLPFIWSSAPDHLPEMRSLVGLSYAVIMASLVAMFCYFKLVRNVQATTLSLTTVLTPIIALLVGAVLNDEKITLMVVFGAGVLLSGLLIYFYQDLFANKKINSSV